VTGPRVLVIDDNSLQLELLQRVLTRDGFEVALCGTIPEVEPVTRQFRPDIVLLDVNIPGAAGAGALPLARAAAPAGTRFYLFSACDESRLRLLARDLKADGWLSKSLPVAEVSRKLKDASSGVRSHAR
jgi:DNA-binding response OmpR family regulator